jgi:hypothetical protein
VFSETQFISLGPSFGIDILKSDKKIDASTASASINSTMLSINFNVNVFQLWDSNVGLYTNVSLGKPLNIKVNDAEADTDEALTVDGTIGPGMSVPFSQDLDLKIGIGLHVAANRFNVAKAFFGIGIGGTIGVNYMFTDLIVKS